MDHLHNIQHQFWNGLRDHETDSKCAQLFSPGGKLTQQERLNIYRDTMHTAHTGALAQTYKSCEKILGEKYFKQIANKYFYEYPATNQNLNLYWQSFPLFLQHWGQNHTELSDYQYLPDLAQLELAYEQAYYAKDDPLFDFSSLAALSDDSQRQLRFKLSAALSILRSNYPIYEIWLANQEHDHSQEINAIHEPQYLCVAREDLKPIIHKIDHNNWWLIEKIQNHFSFTELGVLAAQEGIDIPLQNIIPQLIQNKWICGYYAKHDED